MMRDKKDMDAFVARMAAGRSQAGRSPSVDPRSRVVSDLNTRASKSAPKLKSAGKVSSTAPPKPVKTKSKNTEIPQTTKAANDASPHAPLPTPAAPKSSNKKGGAPTKATAQIVHNHFYK